MRWLILLPILVVALLLVTFGVQNTQLVTVRFLSFEARDLSASIVIILSAIGGALLAGMLGVWNSIQHGLRDQSPAPERAGRRFRREEVKLGTGDWVLKTRHLVTLRLRSGHLVILPSASPSNLQSTIYNPPTRAIMPPFHV